MDTKDRIRSSHMGLNVRDLDRSIAFYEKHLGFRVVSRIELEDGMRIGFMELPEQFQIELVEYPQYAGDGDGPWNHMCMRVADFEESYERLTGEGIIFETEKLFMKEFWDGGMKFAFFRGPDGERLEIAEY